MLKTPLVSLILSLTLTIPVLARLGDTPEQCSQRYGAKYTEKAGDGFWTAERIYELNGIRLTLRFLPAPDGTSKAAYVDYKPVRGKMSEVQVQTLLATVAKEWIPLTELREEKKTEKKPTAGFDENKSSLHTKKVIRISDSEKSQKEKEEMERQNHLAALAAKNKIITETKDRVRSAIEWYEPRSGEAMTFWTIPTAFAGSSPQRVVIFTREYLRQHEKGAETNTGDKPEAPPKDAPVFKGF